MREAMRSKKMAGRGFSARQYRLCQRGEAIDDARSLQPEVFMAGTSAVEMPVAGDSAWTAWPDFGGSRPIAVLQDRGRPASGPWSALLCAFDGTWIQIRSSGWISRRALRARINSIPILVGL
jgi:hypothetical protein